MKSVIALMCVLLSFSTFASDYTCMLSVNPHGDEGEMETLIAVDGRTDAFIIEVMDYKAAVIEVSKGQRTKLELLIETKDGKTVFGAFDKRQLDDELFEKTIELEFYDEEYVVSLFCGRE